VSHGTREWVMSHMIESWHIWMSHVTYEWVTAHVTESWHKWMSHVTHRCKGTTWAAITRLTWMSHVTYVCATVRQCFSLAPQTHNLLCPLLKSWNFPLHSSDSRHPPLFPPPSFHKYGRRNWCQSLFLFKITFDQLVVHLEVLELSELSISVYNLPW